jgi:hypothetical protein
MYVLRWEISYRLFPNEALIMFGWKDEAKLMLVFLNPFPHISIFMATFPKSDSEFLRYVDFPLSNMNGPNRIYWRISSSLGVDKEVP